MSKTMKPAQPAEKTDDGAQVTHAMPQADAEGLVRVRLRQAHTHAGVRMEAGEELVVPEGTAEWLAAQGVV